MFSYTLGALTLLFVVLGYIYVGAASYYLIGLITQLGGEVNWLLKMLILTSDTYWIVSLALFAISVFVIVKFRNTPTGVISNVVLFIVVLLFPILIIEGIRMTATQIYLPYLLN